jgi:hypothetical protein
MWILLLSLPLSAQSFGILKLTPMQRMLLIGEAISRENHEK